MQIKLRKDSGGIKLSCPYDIKFRAIRLEFYFESHNN